MEERLVTRKKSGAAIPKALGARIFHWARLRRGRGRHIRREGKVARIVPKIVPNGGLFPFGSRLARKRKTSMNTGESKRRQIPLNY